MMLKLQDGKCYYAVWQWPKERRFKTDGREMWRDVIYDGPDKMAAVEACEKHLAKRGK